MYENITNIGTWQNNNIFIICIFIGYSTSEDLPYNYPRTSQIPAQNLPNMSSKSLPAVNRSLPVNKVPSHLPKCISKHDIHIYTYVFIHICAGMYAYTYTYTYTYILYICMYICICMYYFFRGGSPPPPAFCPSRPSSPDAPHPRVAKLVQKPVKNGGGGEHLHLTRRRDGELTGGAGYPEKRDPLCTQIPARNEKVPPPGFLAITHYLGH